MVEHTVEHTMVCRRDVYGPAQARQWLTDRLGDRDAAPDLDTLRLVLSELVTNAVLHPEVQIDVCAAVSDREGRVEVSDRTPDCVPVVPLEFVPLSAWSRSRKQAHRVSS